jgi:hypothetical protein
MYCCSPSIAIMNLRTKIELQQNRLLMLHEEAQALLLRYPNVAHVGVGIKERGGRLTSDLCFRVYVSKKMHLEMLKKGEVVPRRIMGMQTDVLEQSGVTLHAADIAVYRPLTGGIMVSNESVTSMVVGIGSGTMGCLARTDDVANKLVGLTARHVLTDGLVGVPRPTGIGLNVGQTGLLNLLGIQNIGTAMALSSSSGGLDCGIVEIDAPLALAAVSAGNENRIQDIGLITGVAQAVCYEVVRKRGFATQVTQGVVVDVKFEGSKLLINPCTEYPNFSEPGDSGAVIVNAANKVVGLLIGASSSDPHKGVGNHIKQVLTALDIKIAGEGASTAGLVGVPTERCPAGGATTCTAGAVVGIVSVAASRAYFRALDDATLFLNRQPGYGANAAWQERRNDIFGLVAPKLERVIFSEPGSWEQRAKIGRLPTRPTISSTVDATLIAAIRRLSTFQLDLFKVHFPGATAGSIDAEKVRITFERFMNGDLRERPTGIHPYGPISLANDGPREPNGKYETLFAGFAWLCIENNIDKEEWKPLYNVMVQCQELFMYVYRRRPQVAPPAGSAPINRSNPVNSLDQLTDVIGNPGFGDQGYTFAHFNLDGPGGVTSVTSIAQSNEARKAFLRSKYRGKSYAWTKLAMSKNIQRMIFMP